MKAKHFFLFLAGLAVMFFSVSTMAANKADGGDDIPIYKGKGDGPNGKPKAPAVIPISATLLDSGNEVAISFLYDLGTVQIELRGTSNGVAVVQTVSSGTVFFHVCFSGTPDHYVITFTTSSGDVYFGEFDVV